jgi:hypothetical protein
MSEQATQGAPASFAAPPEVATLERRASMAGVVGIVVSAIGWWMDPEEFYLSYLAGWLLWLGVALGAVAILYLTHLARGRWGMLIRRMLEAAAKTLPLLALLFIPVVLGMEHLYKWARPAEVAASELLQHKAPYLNKTGFIARAVAYFLIWIGCSWSLIRMSEKQDETGDPTLSRKMRTWAAPCLGLLSLSATFASFDWLMSLDPYWFSSLFGVYFLGGHGVSAFSFIILMALFLARREPLQAYFTRTQFHDYGKFLLAFVMLWAYFSISQYLIIWMGNLPEETLWFAERNRGGWQWVSLVLVLLHFFLPFLLLLSADLKRKARTLANVAVLLLVVRWLDLYWLSAPTFHHHLSFHWTNLTTVVGIGGLWLALFFRQLRRQPLLPIRDHNVQEAFLND